MLRIVGAAMVGCALVAACAASPSPTGLPASGNATADPFILTLDLPRDTWRVGEVIEGTATLGVDTGTATVWGSGGGLIGFEYADVARTYSMASASRLDCAPYTIDAVKPVTSPVWMSGAWDKAPTQQFTIDGKARLPAGTWDITALAVFGRELMLVRRATSGDRARPGSAVRKGDIINARRVPHSAGQAGSTRSLANR